MTREKHAKYWVDNVSSQAVATSDFDGRIDRRDDVDTHRAPNPALLDTLAAAYAEAGDFSRAISTIEEALNRARTSGDSDAIKLSEGFLHHFMAIFPTVKSRNKPIKSPV